MNNKQRGEELRHIIRTIRDGTFDYQSRDATTINWNLYDKAQIHELAEYINNIRAIVDEAYSRITKRNYTSKRGPGKPPTNPADVTKILLLQTYMNSPNRIAEGLLELFKEKLGISKHFSYKTIERGYDRETVNEILEEILLITNEDIDGEESAFSFDGHGFTASKKENYASKRQKQRSEKKKPQQNCKDKTSAHDRFPKSESPKRGFTYSVMGVGIRTKVISGMAISPNHSSGETTLFPSAFHQTVNSHPSIKTALGDGIYACRWIVDMVRTQKISPFFLPRGNVTFKSKGYSGWYDMLSDIHIEPQQWLSTYHMRSISETVNSMIECRFGAPLRKKLDNRKCMETKLKHIGHNIRRIGYLKYIDCPRSHLN